MTRDEAKRREARRLIITAVLFPAVELAAIGLIVVMP